MCRRYFLGSLLSVVLAFIVFPATVHAKDIVVGTSVALTGPPASPVASSSGISGTTISLAKSLSRLTRPMMTTVQGSLPRSLRGAVEFNVMT